MRRIPSAGTNGRAAAAGNPKPSTPTGSRTGGAGSTSNVNAPSYANGYHRSTSAQQNSANPVSSQGTVSAQTSAAQSDTVQSAAEKDGGSIPHKPRLLAPASSPTLRAKLLCRPAPDAPGHMAAPKNHAAPTAAKNLARCAVSSRRSFAARHGRRGHAEHAAGADRTFPVGIPIRAAAHRCRIMLELFCSVRRENGRPKSIAHYRSADRSRRKVVSQQQRTGGRRCRPSLHNSAAPLCNRLTHSEAHRIRSRRAMPNNPASTSATPRALHNLSAGCREKIKCSLRIQKRRSSAVPLLQAPGMASAQPAAEHPASPASPRSGMAGNRLCHTAAPPIPHKTVVLGKTTNSHSTHPPRYRRNWYAAAAIK